jgi:hypothetical protein
MRKPTPRAIRALARFLSGYIPPRHPKPFAKRDKTLRKGRQLARKLKGYDLATC